MFVSLSCNKTPIIDVRTYEYFSSHIKSNMDYNAIINTFGNPDNDRGSGIHIYVYNLTDRTSIWIGFTTTIIYARHYDQNQQLLQSWNEVTLNI